MKNRKGAALVLVNLMALVLVPLLVYLLVTTTASLRHSYKEKQLGMAGGMANSALVDFMRQFSQNYYEGHYDPDLLARNQPFYSAGFSAAAVAPDAASHRLYIEAVGKYGKDQNSPLADKKLYSTVQFISDLTDYGTMINGAFTISASNVTYYGKWWITGNLSVTGSNVRFAGGPLIIGGNMSASGSNVSVDGDVYYAGSLTGSPVINGTSYNFYPSDMVYPALREDYYKVNYSYKITSDRSLLFNAYPSSSAFSIVGTTITVPIVESGMIILGENVNLSVYGTVRGRVTVATTNTSGSKGTITVGRSTADSDLLYYDPLTGGTTTSAVSGNSIALLASNGITFQGKTSSPAQDLTVCGIFFNRGSGNISASGGSARKLYLYGTRNKPVTMSGFGGGTSMAYDVFLNASPPPGLPERPVLMTWHMR
ncbi:MAG: hypothetical protein A3I76_01935 [Elusimicrobia bacterium RIFCSPLOWO2_02_FULL_61_11]|nr:MAG: hypothetical protein A3I76_01935 [Elusimicrobia bacterium RIFCSPLOWO2_02_FULL_61_11]